MCEDCCVSELVVCWALAVADWVVSIAGGHGGSLVVRRGKASPGWGLAGG